MPRFATYRDGGSIAINLDDGSKYFIDYRINTETRGVLYKLNLSKERSDAVQNISELTKVSKFIRAHILNERISESERSRLDRFLRHVT